MQIPTPTEFYGWVLRLGKVDYEKALGWQRGLAKLRREGMVRDTIMLVEHPPVITVGKNGHRKNFEGLEREPYFIERGGDVTYHGPGQLVVYFIFNLTRRGRDVHLFMSQVQDGIISALAEFGVKGRKDEEYTGVWVEKQKIASIGVAVKHWVTLHGAAINLNTDLSDFQSINPCGLDAKVMTSASTLLNKKIDLNKFGDIILEKYEQIFRTRFYPVKLEEIAEDIESQTGSNVI